MAAAARVDEAIVALRRYAAPAAFCLDLLQVLALDLARTAPLRGLPLVVSGALVGLADYQQRVEWDAAVERCNSGYLSSPAMVDCWAPEWNRLLAGAQIGHLVLYLLYFAKHVYNDAATTKTTQKRRCENDQKRFENNRKQSENGRTRSENRPKRSENVRKRYAVCVTFRPSIFPLFFTSCFQPPSVVLG